MPIDMFDTITVASVPNVASTSKDAVAGYVDGHWADYETLVKRFPLDHHVSIAVSSGDNADALDVEPGDAVIAEVPSWVRRQHARGEARPIAYTSLSNLEALLATLRAAGIDRASVRIWMAHYTYDRAVAVGELTSHDVDGVQWTDKYDGRNLDASVLRDDFFALDVPKRKPTGKPKRKPVAKVKKVVRKVKPAVKKVKPHPKVAAAGLSGALAAAAVAYLNSHGVAVTHLTGPEQEGITLAAALLAAWVKSGPAAS